MIKVKRLFLFLLLSAFHLSLCAESRSFRVVNADTVLNRYAQTVGCQSVTINDLTVSKKITGVNGQRSVIVKQMHQPGRIVIATENYRGAFLINKTLSTPDSSVFVSLKERQRTVGAEARIPNQRSPELIELLYDSVGIKPVLEGVEEIDGRKAYRIRTTFGRTVFYSFYDCKTGLKVKLIIPGFYGDSEVRFESYFKTDSGIVFPKKIVSKFKEEIIEVIEIENFTINQGLRDSDFG